MPIASSLLAACLLGAGLVSAQDPGQEAGRDSGSAGPQQPEAPQVPISAFAAPLYLGELPPEVRSLRLIQLIHADVPKAARNVTRTHEETLALGDHIRAMLDLGKGFDELSREYSAAENAERGGVMGSFPEGLLAPQMDAFLFSADVGAVSKPIDLPTGVYVLQRIETYAATRHIFVKGNGEEHRARVQALRERIDAGEDFGAVALEASEDPYSQARGGLFTLFERGANDRLLKAAAFSARVGETVGPIRSPNGWHLIQRVPVEGHPSDLAEHSLIRVRAILISHDNTPVGVVSAPRPMNDAKNLAAEIHDRIRSGEDMAALAREFNDDPGGKERAGDIGWVHRNNPRNASFLTQLFKLGAGEMVGPVLTNAGYVIARREL